MFCRVWWLSVASMGVVLGAVTCTPARSVSEEGSPPASEGHVAGESAERPGEPGLLEEAAAFVPPQPPATEERVDERHRMVSEQIEGRRGGRIPVTDERVLRAMRDAPRHAFVPTGMRARAYHDSPLPIGEGQTISQPYIVAYMTELLDIDETSRVLEIGTGSGYQAAVLAHITPHVWTIEIVPALARRAARDLAAQGYDTVQVREGDGYAGWPEAAPFDAIIITAAAPELPQPLWEQLAPGGRIVMPRGPHGGHQELVVIHKDMDGSQRTERKFPVRFVPFTRSEGPEP